MLKILVIEDNPDHFLLLENTIATAFPDSHAIRHEVELTEGLQVLNEGEFDICLCDLRLPDVTLDESIDMLKQQQGKTPVIVTTSFYDLDIANVLLRHGIQDFLPKEELSPAFLYRICRYAMERKAKQLLLEEQNEYMRTFCDSLSHDFRAHIIRISQVSDIIRESFEERVEFSSEDARWFRMLQNSSDSLHTLVSDLGQFLALDYNEEASEAVSLDSLFRKLKTLIEDTSDETVEMVIPHRLPEVLGRESQLTLLFQNLISNGIKFNRNKPRILVEARTLDMGSRCEIAIADNGIGIDDQDQQLIFSPFRRLNGPDQYEGSGLGLSIVQRIVARHDASLRLESEPGNGSTFFVNLPVVHP